MISTKRAFTLLELLVVIAMIALIIGALATSYTSAQERSRVEKARSEVKAEAEENTQLSLLSQNPRRLKKSMPLPETAVSRNLRSASP